MLGRLMLILVQFVVGWYAALEVVKGLPSAGNLEIFMMAAIFAVLVWAIGLLAAAVMKDVSRPGPPALMFAFAAAVLFSAVTIFPDAQHAVATVTGNLDMRVYPLVGAVLGYAIQS